MLPSSNIQRGNKKLYKVMELSMMYKDVIFPEFLDDIRTARDVAVAIRDEYEEAQRRNAICSYFRRVRIARQFDDAASRALSRTIHITNTAPRRPTQVRTRGNAPDVVIIEEEESIEEEDVSSSVPTASVGPGTSHQTEPEAHPKGDRGGHATNTRYDGVNVIMHNANIAGTDHLMLSVQSMCNPDATIQAGYIRFGCNDSE